MKTTVILQEDLIKKARELTNIKTQTDLIHAGLRALIEQYSKSRLATLSGYDVEADAPKRKRIP